MTGTGQPHESGAPLTCREAELSLGVLVLGALDPAERGQVEAHVAGCARCRDSLAELAPLPGLLNRLDVTEAEAGLPTPPQHLLHRALQDAQLQQKKLTAARRWWVPAAVAAVAVVLAGAAVHGTEPSPPVATPTSTATGPQTDTVLWDGSSTDGAIRASVVLTSQTSGSRLLMTLTGVRAGQRCDLVIWSDDGQREVPASWQATYEGAATVTGSTTVTPQRIRRMIVATPEGDTLLRLWPAH
jgi:anti-sigma factor RsiW